MHKQCDYRLVCMQCSASYSDDGSRLECSAGHGPALLRTVYAAHRLTPSTADSMLRYTCWLPGVRPVETAARTAIYQSRALALHLGLRCLWIAFNGWWPERGATLPTGTFKDLEAVSVVRRLDAAERRTLVIASAGNTALAFARVCSENEIAALIIVPLRGWQEVKRVATIGETVRIVAIADGGYEEAITFANALCASNEFILEGGVRNVGRRDGMGTALLAAAETIGALPDVYFQAVGSAAGALAAYEAALRLIADGRFGARVPRLMLGQNAPFTPIHDAWKAHSVELVARSPELARKQLAQLGAYVLSNVAPPYAMPGGVREALVASNGQTYAVTSRQMNNAMSLFAELEGVAIEPAAGVAVAALCDATQHGDVGADDVIVLHITGGGRRDLPPPSELPLQPALVVRRAELKTNALERARALIL